ncbi:unnamed protein product [Didymodactylos carnosus]|uniref:MTTase N-terminal domain-containing protein n=1 Tax=Didymodactylos carnosus TaxID=1234261 RepID=A0A814SV01_9BILA|nr:unnamed protein product [Didymodactylos carnosus]CAF1151381.1 unnamed protein product [Didymodactylos carnosus]CAF3677464.1 unnamed protein product [Didymodactylos carnosus]CAF3914881.1 unnamed protein product [Didymodactylos carnosus]
MITRHLLPLFRRCYSTVSTQTAPSYAAWREKLLTGPSLKTFIENNGSEYSDRIIEQTLPPYLLQDEEQVKQKRRVYFEVYGCQMNENDTDIAYTFLAQHGGYERVSNEHDADVVLLMTCSIREEAEQKIWKKLKALSAVKRNRINEQLQVGILGCMAERLKEKLIEKEKIVDVVCGPDAYRDLPRLLDQSLETDGRKGVNVLLSLDETYVDVIR